MISNAPYKICFPKYRALVLTLVFCALLKSIWAQDPQFSQFYATPLYTNPAMAGAASDINFGVSYNRSKLNLETPRELMQFSSIVPVFKSTGSEASQIGGIGATVYQDKLDIWKELGIYVAAAYNIPLNFDKSEVVIFSLQGGYIQKSVDESKLRLGSQYSPFVGFDPSQAANTTLDTDRTSFPVINAGVMYHFNPQRNFLIYTGSAFGGLSVSNINRPDESFLSDGSNKVPLILKGHAGVEFYLTSKLKWSPQLLVLYRNPSFQFNAGTYFSYALGGDGIGSRTFEAILGLWYRWQDAAIFSVGFNTASFTLGFSYDFNQSSITQDFNDPGAAFEISLQYRILRNLGLRSISTPLI